MYVLSRDVGLRAGPSALRSAQEGQSKRHVVRMHTLTVVGGRTQALALSFGLVIAKGLQ